MEKVPPIKCLYSLMPIRDALDVLSGKWKLLIIRSIMEGNHRFTQIEQSIPGLSSKVLAEELKDLTEHKLIERIEDASSPGLIEYKLRPHAESLKDVINERGLKHREEVMNR